MEDLLCILHVACLPAFDMLNQTTQVTPTTQINRSDILQPIMHGYAPYDSFHIHTFLCMILFIYMRYSIYQAVFNLAWLLFWWIHLTKR